MANDEGSPQVGVRQRRTRGTAAAEEASSSNRYVFNFALPMQDDSPKLRRLRASS